MADHIDSFLSTVNGVTAVTATATQSASNGVHGVAESSDSSAIYGEHQGPGIGVFGRGGGGGGNSAGVFGESSQGYGIIGHGGDVGVYAHNTTLNPTGGTQNDAYLASPGFAGDFQGNVNVQGNISVSGDFQGNVNVQGNISVSGDILLTGADCAEEFDTAEAAEIEPGTVMVLDQGGALRQCQQAYDKRVAGVISGAGAYRPGLVLDRHQSQDHRVPVALVGKVYCKVDAQYAAIEVGDLLTTSPTLGHAMKADDPLKAFGSVMGKAMHPLRDGQGLIPILITLQ